MNLTKSLQQDQVKHLGPKPPVTTSPQTSVRECIGLMQRHNEGYTLICDLTGKAVGIFTERDVLLRVIGEHLDMDSPVREVMTTDLATVGEHDPITKAIRVLHTRGLRHLPMINDAGQPTGLVSVRRVVEYLVDHFPQAVYNLPPTPTAKLETREGA